MRRILFVIVMLLCTACGNPRPFVAQTDDLRVVMTIDEQTLGFRSGIITITDANGKNIEDAQVTLTAVMKQHGMMNPPLTLAPDAAGYSFRDLEINMVGEWQMQVRIERQNLSTTIDLPIVFE